MSDEPIKLQPEVYDFDEFFVSDDSITLQVPMRGKVVPIKVKKSVGLADRMAAESKAVKVVQLPGGKMKLESQQEEGAIEMVYRCIVEWPFTTIKKDLKGRVELDENGDPVRIPVPITRDNVANLLQDGAMYIYMHLQGMLDRMSDLAPFGSPSGEAS